ncbi:MAG: DUF1566 domain-containing protein [Desulfobacterales bacterium]|nr:DUF1566 domain-containing protein [Desulfobacterales bacterium]
MFESWGGKERIRNKTERFYYFYVDNWGKRPWVCLMERGIKYARVLARIEAPQELVDQCVRNQGLSSYDQSYAIDAPLRQWLNHNVVEPGDLSQVVVLVEHGSGLVRETGLPGRAETGPDMVPVTLRSRPMKVLEADIDSLVRQGNFFDRHHNPGGDFPKFLVDNEDGETVTEMAGGLMWQRGGSDITSIRTGRNIVAELNRARFKGFNDWRLPTIDEALSLMCRDKNGQGLFLHPCFSVEQPFIFTADQRRPGGHWFVDYSNGTVFWASGFNPGGFVRVCRKAGDRGQKTEDGGRMTEDG